MRKLVNFEKLEVPLRRQLLRQYPDGFGNAAMRIEAPNPFYAVLLESDEVTYLVKLNNYLSNADFEDLDDFEDTDSDESGEFDDLDEED